MILFSLFRCFALYLVKFNWHLNFLKKILVQFVRYSESTRWREMKQHCVRKVWQLQRGLRLLLFLNGTMVSFTPIKSQISDRFLRPSIRFFVLIRKGYSIRELELLLLRRDHSFLYVSILSLYRLIQIVKLPDLTFHGGHDHKKTSFFSFSELRLIPLVFSSRKIWQNWASWNKSYEVSLLIS